MPSCSNNFEVAAALFNIAPSGAKLPNKTIDLMISKTEIEKRLKKLKIKDNKVPRGYKKLYLESVLPATQGCDFDFL